MSDERRITGREPIVLVVDYEGVDDLVGDYTENLSTGGTFIHTERFMDIGTDVELVLSFPGLVQPIPLKGVVRWHRRDTDEEPGIGIEFTDLDESTSAELERIINAIARRDPGYVSRVVRVLVVEDNPHVSQLLRDGLGGATRQFGSHIQFEFSEAANGRDALELCQEGRFDAAIIDVYLPIIDGPQVIRELRNAASFKDMPIIAVSAGGDDARQSALEAGADLFLDKPMRLRQVIASMQKLIEHGRTTPTKPTS